MAILSAGVGHLVELSQPEAYDEKYAKWRYDDHPILPEYWHSQTPDFSLESLA